MQKVKTKNTTWKILTLLVAIAGVVSNIYIYYDSKNSIEKKIVETLSTRYEFVDKEMSYEQALEEVDRDIERLNKDNFALKSENADLQEEVLSLENTYDCSEKIMLADSYASLGNYEVAIPILNSVAEKTEDIKALLQDYTSNYENSIIVDAETFADNGNFDEAIAQINKALKILPNSEALIEERNRITPKYLVDVVECYKAENLWLLDKKEHIKMCGKSYNHALYSQSSDIGVTMFNKGYSAYAFYNLNGMYSQLSGMVGHIDFSGSGTIGENNAGQVYDAEMSIWGDDKELCTITLSSEDVTQNFNVPIDDVKILEFRVKCNGNSKVGIAEIQIR